MRFSFCTSTLLLFSSVSFDAFELEDRLKYLSMVLKLVLKDHLKQNLIAKKNS
ncbi:hypothetical protein KFK09_009741 [Dendrobium nobile]|uniref:Uncharacterized protein n=1 Tax=Dendrobium nobile TaxID=94219 RepID=A0A8T3BKC4_DENNO|nr:hypothetical protein KFK09_009741 [Dendrobium nobile]